MPVADYRPLEWNGIHVDTIEIVISLATEEPVAMYVKGWVDRGYFRKACIELRKVNSISPDFEDIEAGGITHEFWRKVPDHSGLVSSRLIKAKRGSRGSFKVTVLSTEEWAR